jgi:hypothetical protein
VRKDNNMRKENVNKSGDIINDLANSIIPQPDCYPDIILEQNQPNPFNEKTTINYFIPNKYNDGNTQIVVADAMGKNELQYYTPVFDLPGQLNIFTTNLETGVYVYGIKYNNVIVKSKKMMVIK